jgi:hypothetical protein
MVPLLLACFALAACTGDPPPPPPPAPSSPVAPSPSTTAVAPLGPLVGKQATGSTGVRLLLLQTTLSVFNADTGSDLPISRPFGADRTNWMTRVGTAVVVSSAATCTTNACDPQADLLVYDRVDSPPRSLGKAYSFGPAADGTALWMIRDAGNGQCLLERQPLTGAAPGSGSPASCNTGVDGETRGGLLLRITTPAGSQLVLIDPATGRTVQQLPQFVATSPDYLLSADGNTFSLLDVRSGAKHPVPKPATQADPQSASLSRDGRYFAVVFADPSISGTPNQSYDLWLFDLVKTSWVHPPSMPIGIDSKHAALDWTATDDVVLAPGTPGTGLGIWRAGQAAWTLTKAPLPSGWQGNAMLVI